MERFAFLQKVLKEIKPTKDEEARVEDTTNKVLERINVPNAQAFLGGSGAKGTWLKGTHDIDIYVKFDYALYKDKSDRLSNILGPILKKTFKNVDELHGSRNYFQIKGNSYVFEIIPILDIKVASEAKNITDVSLLHVQFVKNKIYQNKILGDEIRIAKAFAKANSCYGAESYIHGLSGYMVELLVIYYSSFLNLVKATTHWGPRTTVGDPIAIQKLNKSKIAPLIFIDPVQSDRNAAAALSKEKYDLLISSCKNFLKKPSIRFFEKQELDVKDLKKRFKRSKLIILEIKPKKGKDDVVGAKTLKAFEFIKGRIITGGFKLIESGWDFNKQKTIFFFVVDKKPLSKTVKHYGPPLHLKRGVEAFKKKYKITSEERGRVYTVIRRQFTEIKPFMKAIIKEKYVLERVSSARLV